MKNAVTHGTSGNAAVCGRQCSRGTTHRTVNGYDESLWRLGQLLADECADGYPRGALFWNETASRLIASLAASHTTGAKPANGVLGGAMLRQIRDYLMAHLDEPIDVATLAGMSGRSQFHFSRIFRREVGVSPIAISFTCAFAAPSNWCAMASCRWPRSQPPQASPIRAICPAG